MNLTGPEFLALYAALAAAVLVANWALRNARESEGGQDPLQLTDPYVVAALRGGKEEAARVALVSLVQSGQVSYQGNAVAAVGRGLPSALLETAERAVLNQVRVGTTAANEVARRAAAAPEMQRYERELMAGGLIPDGARKSARWMALWACLAVLWGVAGYRIVDALSRGRRNVAFLVILALGAAVLLLVQTYKRRTTFGDRTLAGMRALFAKAAVQEASAEGRGFDRREAAMLASVWGVGALMAHNDYLFVPSLFPRASASTGSGCGSSCGSSCSSGGGGCGGGGCGGCGGGD